MALNRQWLERMEKEGRATSYGVNEQTLFGREPASQAQAEDDFLQAVRSLAKRNGWRTYHTYFSKRSEPGFPDLVLVRLRVVWVELKTEEGRLEADQASWLDDLRLAGQEVYLWRPSNWPWISGFLTAPPSASPPGSTPSGGTTP